MLIIIMTVSVFNSCVFISRGSQLFTIGFGLRIMRMLKELMRTPTTGVCGAASGVVRTASNCYSG